jgi:hypothetical protein
MNIEKILKNYEEQYAVIDTLELIPQYDIKTGVKAIARNEIRNLLLLMRDESSVESKVRNMLETAKAKFDSAPQSNFNCYEMGQLVAEITTLKRVLEELCK